MRKSSFYILILSILLAFVCAFSFVACSGKGTGTPSAGTADPSDTTIDSSGGEQTPSDETTGHKHTSSDWIVDKQPTTSEEGKRHKECTVCGTELESESIQKLPIPKHTVTFKADGKTVGTVTFAEGDKSVKAPTVPAKTGYNGKWASYTLGKTDITVNAVYTAIEYKVTFKADGTTVATKTYTVENKNITAPAVPAKSGYTGKWESYTLTTGNITVNAVYTANPSTGGFDVTTVTGGAYSDPEFKNGIIFVKDLQNVSGSNGKMIVDLSVTGAAYAQEFDHWNFFNNKTIRIYFKATKSGTVDYVMFKTTTDGKEMLITTMLDGTDRYIDVTLPAFSGNGSGFAIAAGGSGKVEFEYIQVVEKTSSSPTPTPTPTPVKHTATLKVDGAVYRTIEFTEGDTSLTLPAVPAKSGYTGKWESYTLGTTDIVINAVYTAVSTQQPQYNATGKFYLQGSKIIDPKGYEFVPFGTNLLGPNAWNQYANMPDADKMINDWKFNIVRVVMLIDPTKFYDNNWSGWGQNNDIDALVEYFTSRNVVVMLEFHDYTGTYPSIKGNPSQTQLENKWKEVANKYKGNTYVWFNVMNEPGNGSGSYTPNEWLTAHDGAIGAIRGTGAENIVICDGHTWASELGSASTTGNVQVSDSCILTYGPTLIKKYKNVMFSVHMYNWKFEASKFISFVDKVHAGGMAVLCGEYGTTYSYTDYKLNYNEALGSLSALTAYKERNVGILHWAWYDENYTSTREDTTVGGGHELTFDKDGNPTNLSWLGRRMWNIGHGIDEDYKKAYAEIETVMADRAIESGTAKAKFSVVVNNTGSITIVKDAFTVELYINNNKVYTASLPASVFLQKSYCFVTDELTLPSGSFTVKAVIKGASGTAISDTETITFNRSGAYKIISVAPVISGNATAFGEYQVKAVIQRGSMSVNDFKNLTGSFFWNGDYIYGCTTSYDSSTDRLTLTSGKKFRVEGSSVNLSFEVKGSQDGTNNNMFYVYNTGINDSSLSILTNGDFSKGNSGWQSWGNDSYSGGYMYLKPSGGNAGAGNWNLSAEAGSTYKITAKAKVTGGSVTIGIKYTLSGTTTDVYMSFNSTSFVESSKTVTIPDGASNIYAYVWSGSNGQTITIDHIYVVKQ